MRNLIAALMLLSLVAGCQTRGAYTSLASTEKAVTLAYDGYIDSVITGKTPTNSLPTIAKSYNAFQSSMALAVDAASGNTNAPVSADIASTAAAILQAIATAKGVK